MHETSDTDELSLLRQALDTLELLQGRMPKQMALDLGTRPGFDRAVVGLAQQLRVQSGAPDRQAVQAALRALDIDWEGTTAEQRRLLVRGALEAAGRRLAIIPHRVAATFEGSAAEVFQAGRDMARQSGLGVGAELNALDRRAASFLRRSHTAFVTDEHGRRLDDFGRTARELVANSLEAGHGRDEISGRLEAAATRLFIGRARWYWDVVASAFVGQGRTFSQISSFAEAGIERYQVEAVLDEHTTAACRFLHGKTFSVASSLDRFDELDRARQPEAIKSLAPWVRERTTDGSRELYVSRGEERVRIAEVIESAVGRRDERGRFRSEVGDDALARLGVSWPPFHGGCRTTVLPVP